MTRARTTALTLTLALAPLGLLTACGGGSDAPGAAGGSAGTTSSAGTAIEVAASEKACGLSAATASAGRSTLKIKNIGNRATEVYVYAAKDKIMAEKENIGPGTSYTLTVDLKAGDYQVACKPGMVGDGIRSTLAVTGSATTAADPRVARAVTAYRTFVQQQADASLPTVTAFVAAVKAGDRAQAQALFAPSRVGWETVEPVAESFGDLDPDMDLREADLESGQQWTGWHRIEKALWKGGDVKAEAPAADQLLANFTDFRSRIAKAELSLTSIGNGAKELIDEVATGKITGEEDTFSHTDLSDFAANVAGSKKAFEVLRPIVATTAPDLVTRLDASFTAVSATLATYRKGEGYVTYDTVDAAGRRELSRQVDALAEPLSQLTAAAVA